MVQLLTDPWVEELLTVLGVIVETILWSRIDGDGPADMGVPGCEGL